MEELYVGLMSGTSLDGVDGVLVDFSRPTPAVLQHTYLPFPPRFVAELLALNSPCAEEFHRGALAANALARFYADVVKRLLSQAQLDANSVLAIGAHGQTVRHRPQEFDQTGYTLQLNNPALLAELTDIDVIADFRSRDVAAGGQGAPLVPGFHLEFFGRRGETVAVLNLGGIANLTVLPGQHTDSAQAPIEPRASDSVPSGAILGFDCGPGNALLDYWSQLHIGQPFDHDGIWAASGAVNQALLRILMEEPYLAKLPPKSTGRDSFNPAWLTGKLAGFGALRPADVQSTLCEFTARVCAQAVKRHAGDAQVLIVCGGGALNGDLLRRLQAASRPTSVQSSLAHGLPPLQVEAAAFAWLARKTVRRETSSLKSVTGASGARILGAIYPR